MDESQKARILLVGDERGTEESIERCLEGQAFEIIRARGIDEAMLTLTSALCDLAIADQELLDQQDPRFLEEAHELQPDLAVILLSGFGTVEAAVSAMRAGAFDFLSKPVMPEELGFAIERALQQRDLVAENQKLKERLDLRKRVGSIVGTSNSMKHTFEVVASVAPTRATVLITGESGTGKTLLARSIHQESTRSSGPFVEVNCGALPDTLLESELFGHAKGAFTGAIKDKAGKFEEAGGGTIFLDEIGTSSASLQVKLLRVLQDRQFERVGETKTRTSDVRLVLATNCDLEEQVQEGRFREDLYYRINVVNIELPPLRERHEDIPFLLDHFLSVYTAYHGKDVDGFSPEALDYFLSHDWPGNIRELENAAERAIVLSRGKRIEVQDLPPQMTRKERPLVELPEGEVLPLKKALEEPEKRIIQHALELCDWNRQKTADMLEVNRTTLFHKMKKYGLMPKKGG